MSLETPNRTHAAAVLLFEQFETPGEETVQFASNNGFASVRFIDPEDVAVGVVLVLDQPVTNQQGAVALRGDLSIEPEMFGYITPNHFKVGEAAIDELADFQCAIVDLEANAPVFRLAVSVLAMTSVLENDPLEPVDP